MKILKICQYLSNRFPQSENELNFEPLGQKESRCAASRILANGQVSCPNIAIVKNSHYLRNRCHRPKICSILTSWDRECMCNFQNFGPCPSWFLSRESRPLGLLCWGLSVYLSEISMMQNIISNDFICHTSVTIYLLQLASRVCFLPGFGVSLNLFHIFYLPLPPNCLSGRGGNVWLSPKGCAMFSLHVRLKLHTSLGQRVSYLQHITSLAVVEAVRGLQGYEVLVCNNSYYN